MDVGAFQIRSGHRLHLAEMDPRCTDGLDDKSDAKGKLARDIERLSELQDVFAAVKSHALLIVLQGMDAAGKDGAIKHVMSGVNPQGVSVHGFRVPTGEELAHDYLWRYQKAMPERGRIAIFNRSYYEEVLVVRVHKDLLGTEGDSHPNGRVWEERFEDINALERHLTRNGTLIVKLFLHVSKDEQLRRLRARIDDPAKNWKFSMNDVKERRYWDKYVAAYEKMLVATSTSWAPWYAIPADRKWFMRTAIADVLVRELERLNLAYPTADAAQKAMLESVREQLGSER